MPTIICEKDKFRPSDWVERLASNFATFINGKLVYSDLVRPILINNNRAVQIADELKIQDPNGYNWLTSFAEENKMDVLFEEQECPTCQGEGTIDLTLGGEWNSNPACRCPDCDGRGYNRLLTNNRT